MDRRLLDGECVVALPDRIETSLVNVNVNPTINLNVAVPVITQINTGVQVSALSSGAQQMVQGNLAGAGIGQFS